MGRGGSTVRARCGDAERERGAALTDVLLVMLALGGHRLLRSAGAMMGAARQPVAHAVHLLQWLKPAHARARTHTHPIMTRLMRTRARLINAGAMGELGVLVRVL